MTGGFTGIVLAGGHSSRMGQDKALMRLDGRTLLDRALATLRAAGARDVVVGGARPGVAGIADPVAGRGPVGGLAGALAGLSGDVVVVPVDMPGLAVGDLHRLLDGLRGAPAACFERGPLPWAARVDDRLRAAVDALLAAPADACSMRALHRDVGGVTLAVPDGADLRNVNTPDDWAEFASTR